jgi:ribonuclease HIII
MPPLTSHTNKLTEAQIAQVRLDLHQRGFEFREVPYAHFGASKDKLQVVAYESGKLVAQGKGVEEFVQFYLEPEILKEARLGYEHVHDPAILEPRIGVDESGKGDFFGPLVAAGVYLSRDAIAALKDSGVRDSKQISSDKRIFELAKVIRKAPGCMARIVSIGPRAYNDLYAKMGNVNRMLAWAHARVIENVLEELQLRGEQCDRAIADQFGDERLIKNALMKRGREIKLVQRHKAESDLAVAAASIIAREEFVHKLAQLSKEFGVELPKGAGPQVDAAGREFVKKHGATKLPDAAKLHFRTTVKIGAAPLKQE